MSSLVFVYHPKLQGCAKHRRPLRILVLSKAISDIRKSNNTLAAITNTNKKKMK